VSHIVANADTGSVGRSVSGAGSGAKRSGLDRSEAGAEASRPERLDQTKKARVVGKCVESHDAVKG
jgi:hypothetical protein